MECREKGAGWAHLFEPLFQTGQLALLDDEGLIVEILDDVIVFVLVDLEDDGFYRGVAFDQHAWFYFGKRDIQNKKKKGSFGASIFL